MTKSSQKPTNQRVRGRKQVSENDGADLSKNKTSRFSGMAERMVMLEPEIIPGYKIR